LSREAIDSIAAELMAAPGKRYVVLATTANRNNPSFYVGGLRQGQGVAAANFIFATPDLLPEVIARFDGSIEAFLLDTEIKNTFNDLEDRAAKLIRKTPIIRIKPNDMTVAALDLWLALILSSLRGKTVLIVGAGNVGAKIALLLAERGAEAKLLGRDAEKLSRIVAGLAEICRGHGYVTLADREKPATGASVILGCTPGIPAVTALMIEQAATDAIVIDVGNGTLFPEAIEAARQRGIRVFCLSPEAGFIGWMAAFAHAREQIDRMKRRMLPSGAYVIGPGVLGAYGDVLVDNPDNWRRIIGVCDGRGDILSPDEAERFISNLKGGNQC
jgi:hypothetical protein